MIVLGINGGFRQGYQDVSACLVKDGIVMAAIEEERLNRIKFSAGKLPFLSIQEVLKITGISMREVDVVAFHGETWGSEIEQQVSDFFIQHFGYMPTFTRFHHHDCHAAGTFFSSGFSESLVITMDNSGDGVSLQVSVGSQNRLKTIKRFERPHSLGLYYSLITQYCGFVKDSDEYKLMGLAAYGDSTRFDFSWLIDFKDGNLSIDTNFVNTVPKLAPSLHRDQMIFNDSFIKKMSKPRRLPSSVIDQFYKDVAASAQRHLEKLIIKIVTYYSQSTGHKNLCISGGVALNCSTNKKIMDKKIVEKFYIQPSSTDAGISMGAAWLAAINLEDKPMPPSHTFLGNSFDNEDIKRVLNACNIQYEWIEKPEELGAALIHQHKVIGWFQGAMEFGPRALGNRSILANPSEPGIQARVNRMIKLRDSFRPFGASVLEQDSSQYFSGYLNQSPYMTINYQTKKEYLELLAGVTHIDGTCRIQTVNESQNLLFYRLLMLVKEKTGHGICLNTSFNLNYEPIVNTPQNAISTFFGSGLDGLIIGNFFIKK